MLQDVTTTVPYGASAWDSQQLMACVCDVGFFGTDCSQRRCATGDDPVTTCPTTVFGGMVQEVKVTLGSQLVHKAEPSSTYQNAEGMDLFGVDDANTFDAVRAREASAQLLVGATDAYGKVVYAPTAAKAVFAVDAIVQGSAADQGAASLQVALENVRNYRIDTVKVTSRQTGIQRPLLGGGNTSACTDVTVDCPYGAASPFVLEKRYLVTFVPNALDSANFGPQNPLVCASGYSCPVSGCAPQVRMPFLYRYASTSTDTLGMEFDSVSGATFSYFAGSANKDSDFEDKKFLRLSSLSSPQMPLGMTPDEGVSSTSAARFDVRIVVAVQDPADPNSGDTPVDVYWTKVVYGHTNIATDSNEYGASVAAGVWGASTGSYFEPTLLGFTYRGFVPETLIADVADATGVVIEFPDRNMVTIDSNFRYFEILVKLPACSVTPLVTGSEFVAADLTALTPLDPRIENVECSNRGQCNRASGLCECFSGFCASSLTRARGLVSHAPPLTPSPPFTDGLSCSQMTTMV